MSFDARTCSLDALCASILKRHRDTIAVQKPEFALRKLKVIVSAALDISNRKGFQAMSLRDLSLASGVSMGGLYTYFDSKTTLLKMILTEVTAVVKRTLSNPPAEVAANPRVHLLWLIDTHIRMSEEMLPWFTFAFMEAKNFPVAERRLATDSEELTEAYFAGAINEGVRSGIFRADTSPLLPALIKPLMQDWYVKRAKYGRRGVSLQTYIETVQEIAVAACREL